jgi:hypothetical protein
VKKNVVHVAYTKQTFVTHEINFRVKKSFVNVPITKSTGDGCNDSRGGLQVSSSYRFEPSEKVK